MAKQPTISEAMSKTRPPEPEPEKEEIPNAMATKKRRGKRGHTVYVDPVVHEAIKRVQAKRKITLEELWLEGMNHVLVSHGEKAIA
jgi:hypothetical protein